MPRLSITKRYLFQSLHTLSEPPAIETKHGHHYYLEVSFAGCSVDQIDRVYQDKIYSLLQGRILNMVINPPTGENLAKWIFSQFCASPVTPHVQGVAIQETAKNRFEVRHGR